MLHLVDLNIGIYSTKDMPPQQQGWWTKEVKNVMNKLPRPPEIAYMIMEEIGGSMIIKEVYITKKTY
jgi:hypothetical protein